MLLGGVFVVAVISHQLTKHNHSFKHWFYVVSLSGVRKLTNYIGKDETKISPKFLFFLQIFLAISYKYFIPLLIIFVTF